MKRTGSYCKLVENSAVARSFLIKRNAKNDKEGFFFYSQLDSARISFDVLYRSALTRRELADISTVSCRVVVSVVAFYFCKI